MNYGKPANSEKVERKIKWKEKLRGNTIAELITLTGLVSTKRKSIKSSLGPTTNFSYLVFSSVT